MPTLRGSGEGRRAGAPSLSGGGSSHHTLEAGVADGYNQLTPPAHDRGHHGSQSVADDAASYPYEVPNVSRYIILGFSINAGRGQFETPGRLWKPGEYFGLQLIHTEVRRAIA